MTVKEIYEKVNLKVPLEQRRFFDYYNDTLDELNAAYADNVLESGTEYAPIGSIYDPYTALPLYASAIVDNILFLAGFDKDGKYRQLFLSLSSNAHKKYSKKANRIIKRARW